MKEYTAREMKLLKANPYTFKVTKNKLYFTMEFKETFWTAYQAGMAPRKILEDLGYDLEMFGQKQIDSMVQSMKRQAGSGNGFRQGENRTRRKKDELFIQEGAPAQSKETLEKEKIRKKRILDAAIKVIKEKGIDKTSMREIAAEAGMTTGAIYYSYKNREELFQDIVDRSIHFAPRILNDYQSDKKTGEELLSEIKEEITYRLTRKDEQLLHLSLLSELSRNHKESDKKEQIVNSYRNIIKSTGDLFAPAFDISDTKEKYIAASFLTAAIDGMALLMALDVYPAHEEEMIDAFLDFFGKAIPDYLERQKTKDEM